MLCKLLVYPGKSFGYAQPCRCESGGNAMLLLYWEELPERAKEWETGRGDKDQRFELFVQ